MQWQNSQRLFSSDTSAEEIGHAHQRRRSLSRVACVETLKMRATSAMIPAPGEPSLERLYFWRIFFVYEKNTKLLTQGAL